MAKTNLCILTPYVFQSVHNTISYLSSCFWMCFGVFGQFVIVSKCFRTFLQKPMTYALLPMDLWSKISQDGYGWHAGPCAGFLARRSGRQHWSNWVFARDRNYWEIWGPLSCRDYDMIVLWRPKVGGHMFELRHEVDQQDCCCLMVVEGSDEQSWNTGYWQLGSSTLRYPRYPGGDEQSWNSKVILFGFIEIVPLIFGSIFGSIFHLDIGFTFGLTSASHSYKTSLPYTKRVGYTIFHNLLKRFLYNWWYHF